MTHTIQSKLIIAAVFALLACSLPMFTHAATPTEANASVQSQYKLLMERFETLKNKNASTSTSTKSRGDKASSTVDRTCMAAAVNTREESIATAWDTFTTSITTGLSERKTALATAWNTSENGSREAIKKAWEAWRGDKKDAHTKLRSDRKAAWDAFKKTAKESCKVETPKEEAVDKPASDSIAL